MGGKDLLERLKEGVVLGDGSYAMTLERRGYVTCGPFTPEAVLQYPGAVKQLSREFARAGADIVQAYSFYGSDSKLEVSDVQYDGEDLNHVACEIAREIAEESGCLVVGGVSPTPTYVKTKDKAGVKKEFQKQVDVFVRNKVDFVLAEFFIYIEEIEWAIEVMKSSGLPVAATMRIGPIGDMAGVSPGQCAVRMAKAGADIVGVNCNFDPKSSIRTLRMMKEALEKENLHPYLMAQPLGFHCLDSVDTVDGYMTLPEYPYALEPRLITRWDARQFAREAYELGVRYIGGCCGFEPYHIREMAEELAGERGKRPPGKDKNGHYGSTLDQSVFPYVRKRQGEEYWSGLKLATGRDTCCFSKPEV